MSSTGNGERWIAHLFQIALAPAQWQGEGALSVLPAQTIDDTALNWRLVLACTRFPRAVMKSRLLALAAAGPSKFV
jgi:hypothetical protein